MPAHKTLVDEPTLARRLLKIKETGYTFRFFVALNLRRHAFIVIIVFSCAALLRHLGVPHAWEVFGAYFIGVMTRDIAWFRAIRAGWPFSEKVTDWEKVRRIAGDERAAPPPLGTDGPV